MGEKLLKVRNTISENTLVPIGFLIIIVGIAAYAENRFTKLEMEQITAKEKQIEMDRKQQQYNSDIQVISDRLSNIEGALGVKPRR